MKRRADPDKEVWKKWRRLVNMNRSELERFMQTEAGKQAGLSPKQAKQEGIKSGRISAKWLLRMMPTGRSFTSAKKNWTPEMWRWARRQVSFNARMRKARGPLYKKGKKTRKHTSLLIWGHNPRKPLRNVK